MSKRKIEVNYLAGHTYTETWDAAPDLHCPACGEKTVWHEDGEGDYYVGERFMCASTDCAVSFYLPEWPERSKSREDKQRIAALQ